MHCRRTITWIEIGCWLCWIIDRLFRRHPLGLLLVIRQIDPVPFGINFGTRLVSPKLVALGQSISPGAGYIRSSPMSGYFRCPSACLKSAMGLNRSRGSALRPVAVRGCEGDRALIALRR